MQLTYEEQHFFMYRVRFSSWEMTYASDGLSDRSVLDAFEFKIAVGKE